MVVGRLSANLQQRCYRNIGLAVQMMWQFEAVGRRPQEDGPAWNAFKNVGVRVRDAMAARSGRSGEVVRDVTR